MAVSKKNSSSKSSSKGLGKGLGRGINALIPEEPAETNEKVIVKEVVVKEPAETKVRLSQVEPNREQPRKMFDEDALIVLSESIYNQGNRSDAGLGGQCSKNAPEPGQENDAAYV